MAASTRLHVHRLLPASPGGEETAAPSGYSQRSMVYIKGSNSPTALNVHRRRQIIQLKQFHVLIKKLLIKS